MIESLPEDAPIVVPTSYLVAIYESGRITRWQQQINGEAIAFTSTISNAKHYMDRQEALDFVESLNVESETGKRVAEGGKRYPSNNVAAALNIHDTSSKKYTGQALVIEYAPTIILSSDIYGSIQEPIGYTYDET